MVRIPFAGRKRRSIAQRGPARNRAGGQLPPSSVASGSRVRLFWYVDLAATGPGPGKLGRDISALAVGCDRLGEPMENRSERGDGGADQRRSAALIGLIIILALAIAGVVLVRELRQRSRFEDCLMSGRTNCAPIDVPLRR
jgi:hypothetical protein